LARPSGGALSDVGRARYCGAGPSWQARWADQFGTSHFEQALSASAQPAMTQNRIAARAARLAKMRGQAGRDASVEWDTT
jgi:hypothetical protein